MYRYLKDIIQLDLQNQQQQPQPQTTNKSQSTTNNHQRFGWSQITKEEKDKEGFYQINPWDSKR